MSGEKAENSPEQQSGGRREGVSGKLRRLRPWMIGVWTLVIWGHSLLPASQSSAESGQVLALLEPLLRLTGLAPELWHTVIRKCAHMAEFAVLGGLWSGTPGTGPVRLRDRLLTIGFACMATALLDETIQLFRPGRSGQISDVWVDLCGAAIGIAAAAAWRRLRVKAKS